MIDIVSYLNDRGIPYAGHGQENVGPNDVAIDCPFCGEHGRHLAIHKTKGLLNCWVCKFAYLDRKPSIVDLVMELEPCSFPDACDIVDEYRVPFTGDEKEEERAIPSVVKMPRFAESFFKPIHKHQASAAFDYLVSRRFGIEEVERYKLKFCVRDPDHLYQYRIVVPIYLKGVLVNFTARDFTDKQKIRYRHCLLKKCIVTMDNLLYPFDEFAASGQKHLRLVEGVTDRWRLGLSSLACMKNNLSNGQLSLLSGLGLESASVIFDPGSEALALAAGQALSTFVRKIRIVKLGGKKDVAERSRREVFRIENNTRWRTY